MCLVCDYRVMSEAAQVGLPEIKLGIFPGFGGTVRLSRLIGIDNAVEWMAMANPKRPDAALKDGAIPDGICIDAEDAIWVASPMTGDCQRIKEGGEVTDRIVTGRQAIACTLGGSTGDMLYVATAESVMREECLKARSGRIEKTRVKVPAGN